MRVITWNINSVRLRINSVKRAVKKLDPDVLCLQETKCLKEDFPFQDFENMGFVSTETYGIKGYNGVCIASKHRCLDAIHTPLSVSYTHLTLPTILLV